MIARCIHRRVGKLGRYTRLVRYLLDPQNKHERVGAVAIAHCHSTDASIAALEVEAVQAQNRRATSDKTYHLLISFPPGEAPAPEVLQAIEAKLVERLGFSEHQRVSVVHHDTDHLHVHVAINKVHPTRLTLHTPYRDFKTLARACEELEQQYQLERVNHAPRRERNTGARDMERHSGLESFVSWARQQCLVELKQARTWDELHRAAAQHGLSVQLRGAGCVLVHDERALVVKASSVARELALGKLVERLGPYVSALDGDQVTEATPLTEANQVTDVSAAQALEDVDAVYKHRPAAARFDTRALFAQYELERVRGAAERGQRLTSLDAGYVREIETAKRKAAMRRLSVKMFGRDRVTKRLMYAFAKRALRKELAAIRERYRQGKRDLNDGTRRTGWTGWLQQQANAGNDEALRALRKREGSRPLRGDLVTGAGAARSSRVPSGVQTTKAGVLVYRVGGIVVREDASAIRVGRGATGLELREVLVRAAERHGPVLHVEGEAEFRRNVARTAALSGLAVRFDDAQLEAQRQTYRSDYERWKSSSASRASEPNTQRAAGPQAKRQDRVRDMPARGLVQHGERREGVLPSDVRRDVVAKGAERDQALRRRVPRVETQTASPPPAARARQKQQRANAAQAARGQGQLATPAVASRGVPPHARGRAAATVSVVQKSQPIAAPQSSVAALAAQRAGRPAEATGQHVPPPISRERARVAKASASTQRSNTPARLLPARPVGAVGQASPPPRSRRRLQPMSVLDVTRGPSVTATSVDAVAAYVSEREGKRQRGLDVPKHRAFELVRDAGSFTFAGRRDVAGVSLVLLQRDERDGRSDPGEQRDQRDKEIVVMKVQDNQQLSWWARQRIGRVVHVDARGLARGRGR